MSADAPAGASAVVSARRLLTDLCAASEKAARIARACRRERDLFDLLIQEKTGGEKNARFAHDFKTLADVLIQETVKHDVGCRHPAIRDSILGEESNVFTNALGETVRVKVGQNSKETAAMLAKVLDGNDKAASILAERVHEDPAKLLSEEEVKDLHMLPEEGKGVDVSKLGIWIDPIDSTSSYIRGTIRDEEFKVRGDIELTSKGLQVVTVLIGVFNKETGRPIAGVINQPFTRFENNTWHGQIYWGIRHNDVQMTSSSLTAPLPKRSNPDAKRVMISATERERFQDLLQTRSSDSYELCPASGAGYKTLCVARGLADLYACSSDSTYRWDICAGQGILVAFGGGALQYTQCMGKDLPEDLDHVALHYHMPNDGDEGDEKADSGIGRWCNRRGVLAYKSEEDARRFVKRIKNQNTAGPAVLEENN